VISPPYGQVRIQGDVDDGVAAAGEVFADRAGVDVAAGATVGERDHGALDEMAVSVSE
jgi:hypothetical protein